jgi:hypothetical protein
MNYIVYICFIFHTVTIAFPCIQYGIKHTHYQDIFINNTTICKGYGQDCESRYKAVQKIANEYTRPFTILEIGPAEGYMSFRLASEYPTTCIMIEDVTTNNTLVHLAQLNSNLDNLVLLDKKITVEEIQHLADCEHFDIILVMNVVHHFGPRWKDAINAMLQLGDNIIIETPPATKDIHTFGIEYLPLIEHYLDQLQGKIIARTPRWSNPSLFSNMYWFARKKSGLGRTCWLNNKNTFPEKYCIESNYDSKILCKTINNKKTCSEWKPGINLITFKMLSGVYPSKEVLITSVLQEKDNQLASDCLPHNMIIQGNNIALIDLNDERFQDVGWPCNITCQKIIKLLELTNPDDIKAYYYSAIASIPAVAIDSQSAKKGN